MTPGLNRQTAISNDSERPNFSKKTRFQHQKPDQDADDGDYDEQFDDRKTGWWSPHWVTRFLLHRPDRRTRIVPPATASIPRTTADGSGTTTTSS
jgi:hypothetical protein